MTERKGHCIIKVSNGVTRMAKWRMAKPVDFELYDGEHIAIYGENGSGKNMLVDIIRGSHPLIMSEPTYDFSPSVKQMVSDNICLMAFRDCYGGDNDRTYFLQQRWNQLEIDESTPTVEEFLKDTLSSSGSTESRDYIQLRNEICQLFGIQELLGKYIILLSSGELRKVQLTRMLLKDPRVLIIDNPFIGLDATTREQLNCLLQKIAESRKIQLILVVNRTADIPSFITHVVEVKKRTVLAKKNLQVFLAEKKQNTKSDEIIKMENVTIKYGKRTILHNFSWTVRKGEKWALGGSNGSGKSTLLSLICADNPQSYACNISLFGIQRGTGESIWDIKKRIGYVSPEMHRAYQKDIPCIKIVASGLQDSIGLYFKMTEKDKERCRHWMTIFGVQEMEERSFLQLSSGEHRLVLLARAFVKEPELLILDEPLHGLDDKKSEEVKSIILKYFSHNDKTLIMVSHYEHELPDCINHRINLIKNE